MFVLKFHKLPTYCILIVPIAVTLLMSQSLYASELFPEPAYITVKLANEVITYPSENIWKGGPNMLYNTITPDGTMLLATSPNTANVYAFDTKTGSQLSIIKVGKASKGLKISPNGKEVYVSNEGDNTISVINIKSLSVVATIKVDEKPHNVRFNSSGNIAYVTLQGGAGLGVINTKSRKMTSVIPVPGLTGPHNLDLSNDDKTAYVRDLVGNVAIVDLNSRKVIKILEVGKGHAGIDMIPNGRYVFTGAIADNIVTVIDTKSLTIVKKIIVGFGPHGVRASKNSRWVYASITSEDKVVVIDTETLKISKTFKTNSFPFWIAINGNP